MLYDETIWIICRVTDVNANWLVLIFITEINNLCPGWSELNFDLDTGLPPNGGIYGVLGVGVGG